MKDLTRAVANVRRGVLTAAVRIAPRTAMRIAKTLFVDLMPFEPDLKALNIILPKLHANTFAIDVGANIGLFAAFLAQHFAKVWAIEPNPKEARLLRKWLPRHAEVIETALSDFEGQACLSVPKTRSGLELSPLGSLAPERRRYPSCLNFHGLAVPIRTLDAMLAGSADRAELIKIDVEGLEWEVLSGAQSVVLRDRPILIVEHSKTNCHSWDAVPRRLEAWGYRLFRASGKRLKPFALRMEGSEAPGADRNIIALHSARHHELLVEICQQRTDSGCDVDVADAELIQ